FPMRCRSAVQLPNSCTGCASRSRHSRKVTLIADVYPPSIGMDDLQAGIVGNQPPPQLPTLLAIQRAFGQPLECRFFTFAHILLLWFEIDQGAARLAQKLQTLQRGQVLTFCKAGPPPINTSRQPKSC